MEKMQNPQGSGGKGGQKCMRAARRVMAWGEVDKAEIP